MFHKDENGDNNIDSQDAVQPQMNEVNEKSVSKNEPEKHKTNDYLNNTNLSTMPTTGKTVQQRLDALNRLGGTKATENLRYSVDAKVAPNTNNANKNKTLVNISEKKRHSFAPDLNQLEQERKDRLMHEKALHRKKMITEKVEEKDVKKSDTDVDRNGHEKGGQVDLDGKDEEPPLSPTIPENEEEEKGKEEEQLKEKGQQKADMATKEKNQIRQDEKLSQKNDKQEEVDVIECDKMEKRTDEKKKNCLPYQW